MTAPSPLKPKKPLWRRLVKWTFRTLVVLVVLAVAAYAITSYWAARTLHNEIARIRAAGEPLTFAELDALTPKVDRAHDAGPYYTAAAELTNLDFISDDANDRAFFGRNAPTVPPEMLAKAHQSLDQNRLALDLLDRGSALSGCNSDIQLQHGFEVAFPHMSKPRSLLNVASLRSRVLALDGKGDQAIDSVISALGLLRTMDRQPVILDTLVQTAMLARCCGDVRIVLEKGHPSDAALQKLSDTLLRLHLIQPRQMFIAERVYFLEISRNFIAMGPRNDPTDPGGESSDELSARESWSSLGITGRVIAARSLPAYARYIDAASRGWPAVMTGVEKAADQATSAWDKTISSSIVTAMVVYGRSISLYRSTLIAIQIERFRRAHAGQLPDSLAQLPEANAVPKDPFTGNDLLFLKTPDGYCVFSAGRGHPEDSDVNRDKDPVAWSRRWGIHVRIPAP